MGTGSGLLLSFVLAVLPGACACTSADTTQARENHDPADVHRACESMAIAHCSRLSTCAPAMLFRWYVDYQSCVDMVVPWCFNAGLEGQTIGAGFLRKCASAVATMGCEDFVSDLVPPGCQPPSGPGAYREPCAFSSQCQSGLLCQSSGRCGVCGYPGYAGQSCYGTPDNEDIKALMTPISVPGLFGGYDLLSQGCNNGMRCFVTDYPDPGRGECRTIARLGEDCSSRPCSHLGMCRDGICVPLGRDNEPCTLHEDCDYLKGFLCSHEGLCKPRPHLAEREYCGGGTVPGLCRGYPCSGGVCPTLLKAGASCVWPPPGQVDSFCEVISTCVDGLCTLVTPEVCAKEK